MPSGSRPVPLERCGRDRSARNGRGRQDALLLRQLPCPAAAPVRRDHWPQLIGLHVRYHGQFAYIEGELADGDRLPLIRLRYSGSASTWGFGLYLASSGQYEDQILPPGLPIGTPKRLRLRPLPGH